MDFDKLVYAYKRIETEVQNAIIGKYFTVIDPHRGDRDTLLFKVVSFDYTTGGLSSTDGVQCIDFVISNPAKSIDQQRTPRTVASILHGIHLHRIFEITEQEFEKLVSDAAAEIARNATKIDTDLSNNAGSVLYNPFGITTTAQPNPLGVITINTN